MELKIYSRWGQLVFESQEFTEGWNGKYKDFDCEVGVYVYYLTGNFSNNEVFMRKGNISLKVVHFY